jgi:hypothetical protein
LLPILLPPALVFQELEVARSALEGCEAAGAAPPVLEATAAVERRSDRGGADEASEQERPDAAPLVIAFHGLILELGSECSPVDGMGCAVRGKDAGSAHIGSYDRD